MECKNCAYWYKDVYGFNHCHWKAKAPGELPPCEEDDYYDDEEDYCYD